MSGSPATAPAPPFVFACPRCRAALAERENALSCPACGAAYPVVNGIPTFVEDDGYWGEIPAEDMAWLVAEVERGQPWRDAIRRTDRAAIRRKVPFLLDERRANWVLDLKLPAAATVLDLGAGMGGVAAGLAPHAGRVVALERVALRARFAAARFAADGLRQVTVVRGDAHHLPFPPQSFDLVVLSGVLEWLGKGSSDPGGAQLAVLRRLREILRPGGTLAVGIENRIGIWFFFGREDHSYLPFTSLLPRFAASLVTRAKRGHSYDTYTYTERGYRRLFARAGFGAARTLLPVWSYNEPDFLLSVGTPGPRVEVGAILMGTGHKRARLPWIRRLHVRLRLSRTFANDFIFLAGGAAEPGPGAIAAALRARWRAWGLGDAPDRLSFLIHNRSQPTLVVFAADAVEASVVARLAPRRDGGATTREAGRPAFSPPRTEVTALRRLAPLLTGQLAGAVPRPLDLFVAGPWEIGVTTYLQGVAPLLPAGDPLGRGAVREATALVAAALGWLADFHRLLAPDAPQRELTGSEVAAAGEAYLATLDDGGTLRARFAQRLAGAGSFGRAVRAPQHGDFVLANLRLAGKRVGVIDWERFERVALPGFDALHFVNYTVFCLLADPRTHRVDPAVVVAHLLGPSPLGAPLRAELGRYLALQGLDPNALPELYLGYLAAFGREYGAEPARRDIVRTMTALLGAALAR